MLVSALVVQALAVAWAPVSALVVEAPAVAWVPVSVLVVEAPAVAWAPVSVLVVQAPAVEWAPVVLEGVSALASVRVVVQVLAVVWAPVVLEGVSALTSVCVVVQALAVVWAPVRELVLAEFLEAMVLLLPPRTGAQLQLGLDPPLVIQEGFPLLVVAAGHCSGAALPQAWCPDSVLLRPVVG